MTDKERQERRAAALLLGDAQVARAEAAGISEPTEEWVSAQTIAVVRAVQQMLGESLRLPDAEAPKAVALALANVREVIEQMESTVAQAYGS